MKQSRIEKFTAYCQEQHDKAEHAGDFDTRNAYDLVLRYVKVERPRTVVDVQFKLVLLTQEYEQKAAKVREIGHASMVADTWELQAKLFDELLEHV
jgi:hypothetical protein